MSKRYASNTTVSVAKTKGEIEQLLQRHGATGFGYICEEARAAIAFTIADPDLPGAGRIEVRTTLVLPDPNSDEFTLTPTGIVRHPDKIRALWETACRASWRALLLLIRAKLESVQAGITTIEEQFMSDVLLPSGETVGQTYEAQRHKLQSGDTPLMLTAGGAH